MRKIKFRGRSAFNGIMFVGDLVTRRNGVAIRPPDDETMPLGYKVHEDSVEEYTGFDDIDGLEIYEGDHLVAAKAAWRVRGEVQGRAQQRGSHLGDGTRGRQGFATHSS